MIEKEKAELWEGIGELRKYRGEQEKGGMEWKRVVGNS